MFSDLQRARGSADALFDPLTGQELLQQVLSFDEPGASAVSGRAPLRMAVRCLVLDEAEEHLGVEQ